LTEKGEGRRVWPGLYVSGLLKGLESRKEFAPCSGGGGEKEAFQPALSPKKKERITGSGQPDTIGKEGQIFRANWSRLK